MLIAEFSSRSSTRPQVPQRYTRFQSGIGCLLPHPLQVLLVSRSSNRTSSFPARRHLYSSICTKPYSPQSLKTSPMLGALFFLMRFHDHLPLGKITNHHSSFNQLVSDEMRCLMQTVPLFVALLL